MFDCALAAKQEIIKNKVNNCLFIEYNIRKIFPANLKNPINHIQSFSSISTTFSRFNIT
jgi:hypothetical protein